MKPVLLLLPLIIALANSGLQPDHDVLFNAMNDELARSVHQLRIEKHDKPYYVSYRIEDCETLDINASFGAITKNRESRSRRLFVDVHVGDYQLDSGNMRSGFAWAELAGGSNLTLDDDYDAIRHNLWLKTDYAYKHAVQNLEKKKAALQQRNEKERPDDWSHEKPFVLVQTKQEFSSDRAAWKTTIKNLSSIFKDYPKIRKSNVDLSEALYNKYFVDSEGSKSRINESTCVVTATATAQASDGTKIADSIVLAAIDERHMPSSEEMELKTKQLAQRLTKAIDAKEPDSYEGPVLLQGEAAADFFSRALAPNVVVKRAPDDEVFHRTDDTSQSRIGRRILPTFINVIDDPTLKDASGTSLPTSSEVDNEGVATKRVVLVEKGILKTLLSTRLPTLKVKNSSGHSPGGNNRAVTTNLIIQSDEKLDPANLKTKLLALGKEDALEYVLVVRKMSWTPVADMQGLDMEGLVGAGRGDRVTLPLAVDVSRLYLSDGHEEALRGSSFASSTMRILRDIAATGDDSQMYTQPGASSSITTPSIILRDVEIQKPHSDVDKPPMLVHPYFEKEPGN
jgi:predicted Zn-dependent protease